MALSYPARAYAGRASAGTTDAAIGSSFGTGVFHSQSSAPLTGWTDVTGANWAGTPTPQIVVALGYGTAYEEKILCTYNPTGSALTVVTRGYDNTPQGGSTSTWPIGTPFVLVWSATEAAEANAAVRALQPTLASGYTVLNNHSTVSLLTSFGTSPTLVTPNLGTPTAVNLANGTGLPTTGIASGALPSGVTLPATQLTTGTLPSGVAVPYASLTGAPVAPAAATASVVGTSTGISLSTGTTPLLPTNANPTGSFTNYTWHAMCKQQSTITGPSDFNFVILQRLVGGSTWTAVATVNVGTAATALQYQNIAASGAWSSSGATDSEFQLAIGNVTNNYSWTANSVRLTVVGLS